MTATHMVLSIYCVGSVSLVFVHAQCVVFSRQKDIFGQIEYFEKFENIVNRIFLTLIINLDSTHTFAIRNYNDT